MQVAKGQPEASRGGGGGAAITHAARVPRAGVTPIPPAPHARHASQGAGVAQGGKSDYNNISQTTTINYYNIITSTTLGLLQNVTSFRALWILQATTTLLQNCTLSGIPPNIILLSLNKK